MQPDKIDLLSTGDLILLLGIAAFCAVLTVVAYYAERDAIRGQDNADLERRARYAEDRYLQLELRQTCRRTPTRRRAIRETYTTRVPHLANTVAAAFDGAAAARTDGIWPVTEPGGWSWLNDPLDGIPAIPAYGPMGVALTGRAE